MQSFTSQWIGFYMSGEFCHERVEVFARLLTFDFELFHENIPLQMFGNNNLVQYVYVCP